MQKLSEKFWETLRKELSCVTMNRIGMDNIEDIFLASIEMVEFSADLKNAKPDQEFCAEMIKSISVTPEAMLLVLNSIVTSLFEMKIAHPRNMMKIMELKAQDSSFDRRIDNALKKSMENIRKEERDRGLAN